MSSRSFSFLKSFRSDQEFLPAALEILETPPAPLHTIFIYVICSFVIVALLWSYFSKIDVIAVAQGKVQPTGNVKIVQPAETGKVARLYAVNGQHVTRGEKLVDLDDNDALAEELAAETELLSETAEITRRKIAIKTVKLHRLTTPAVPWNSSFSNAIKAREERVLDGDLAQLRANVTSLISQEEQKELEHDRLVSTIDSHKKLLLTLRERVDMRTELSRRGAGSRASVLDALQELQSQETALTGELGQEKESQAAIQVLLNEIVKAYDGFIADYSQKLAEAEKRAESSEQRLIKARVKEDHLTLTSPIDGTVQALSITTIGQVISTAEEVMRIVPDKTGLVVQCYLPNKDAGFVVPGQEAIVKIESFPFTRYGSLNATVSHVSKDAIPQQDGDRIEGDPAKSPKSIGFAGTERVQNLVFPVTLNLAATAMDVDGRSVPLSPGMTVNVEIKTGSRRILEYVFSPLVEVASSAMRER